MRLVILAVGSPRDRAIASAVRDYEERARRYFRLEAVEVPAATAHGGDAFRARQEEAGSLVRRLPPRLEVWALTRSGTALDTRDLARELEERATYSRPGIVFVIGGAFGLGDEIVDRADRRLSLSAMTLPHDLARLFLAEQLYRVGTILRGEPYHKGA